MTNTSTFFPLQHVASTRSADASMESTFGSVASFFALPVRASTRLTTSSSIDFQVVVISV